jgi:hypothetical protein
MLARLAGSRTDVFGFCAGRPLLLLAGSRVPPLTPPAIIGRWARGITPDRSGRRRPRADDYRMGTGTVRTAIEGGRRRSSRGSFRDAHLYLALEALCLTRGQWVAGADAELVAGV